MNSPKVIHKNLGKQGAWGQWKEWVNTIELDHRLAGKKHLEIILHESLHWLFPDMSESNVKKSARKMANILWSQKYRRIDDREKQPKT